MKTEEKIVAFMFFSVVMQFVYSLEKKTEFWGRGWRGTRAEDRRAKFQWQITGNSSKNNGRGLVS